MNDNDKEYNYTSEENNALISYCSSQAKGCSSKHILSPDRKSIWLSDKAVPQIIIIDLSKASRSPKEWFKFWGLYCWHAYSTNPKIIEIQFSQDNTKYFSIGNYEISMKPGTQFFPVNWEGIRIKQILFIKLIIKETFGGNRTYLNQIFFFDSANSLTNAYNVSVSNNESQSVITGAKRGNSEGQSFFNSQNLKEDDWIYDPVEPMKEVNKVPFIERNDNLEEEDDDNPEEEDIDNNIIQITNNEEDSENVEQKLNNWKEEKEKKLKKIERIWKSKIKGVTSKTPTNTNNIQNVINSKPRTNTVFKTPTNTNDYFTYQDNPIISKNQNNVQKHSNPSDTDSDNDYFNTNKKNNNFKPIHNYDYNKTQGKPPSMKAPDNQEISARGTRGKYYSLTPHLEKGDIGMKNTNPWNINTNNNNNSKTIAYSTNHQRNLTPMHMTSKKGLSLTSNKLQSSQTNDEYKKLQSQLQEMEDQIQSMNINNTIDVTHNLTHSKSWTIWNNNKDNWPAYHNRAITINTVKDGNNDLTKYFTAENPNNWNNNNNNNNNHIYNNQSDLKHTYQDMKTIAHTGRSDTFNLLNANHNSLSPEHERIKALEDKVQNMEKEWKEMKNNFSKLSDSIQILIDHTDTTAKNREREKEQIIHLVLKECSKMITSQINEYHEENRDHHGENQNFVNQYPDAHDIPNTHNTYHRNNYPPNHNISTDSNWDTFEVRLNKKIEEKFDVLTNNIENQIYNDFLKPSIKAIEQTMKTNFEDIKDKVNKLNVNASLGNANSMCESQATSFIESYRLNKSIQSSEITKSNKKNPSNTSKMEEINKIEEKLLDKLLEKEKKLRDLKMETTNYLKKKIKNEDKKTNHRKDCE